MPSAPLGWRPMWVLAAFVAVYLSLISFGFGPYLSDGHAFRQTQTAITARYLSSWTELLQYQTPVLGPPWVLPFEFPLYQALAKGLQQVSGWTLVSSGRVVSVCFFLLCLWPLYRILRWLRVAHPPLVLGAVLLAPVYVFWSRAFMIETTALFFALCYSAEVLRLWRAPEIGAPSALLLFIVGSVAALTKVTTFLPLYLVAMAAVAWSGVAALRERRPLGKVVVLLGVHVAIALVALAWVSHTDALKQAQPLGALLTSSVLRAWNFGTPAQRIDPHIWFQLANNSVDMFFPLARTHVVLKGTLALLWAACFAAYLVCCAPKRRRQVAALCGLFLLPMAIFTNLQRIHDYYQAANGVFLCIAFGLAAHGAIEVSPTPRRTRAVLASYGAMLLAFALVGTHHMLDRSSHRSELVALSSAVQRLSPADATIVVTGLDWSAELPFQSDRRALMLADSFPNERVDAALSQLKASQQPAVLYVACGKPGIRDAQVRDAFAIGQRPATERAGNCDLLPL